LSDVKETATVYEHLREVFADSSEGKLKNWARQIRAFVADMSAGDWVALPRKQKAAIAIGEIKGSYEYEPDAGEAYRHTRDVEWLNKDVPRSVFDQDILYSLGAFLTICQIKRNDAEARVRAMAEAGWQSVEPSIAVGSLDSDVTDEGEENVDLELLARDEIAKLISRRFKGHGMARLVEAVLQVQGYVTYRSPAGPDKGVDIMAATGPLGFGQPRIAVQVKSGEAPVDRPTLDQLIGTMQNVQANQGLLVAWGGFKSSVDKETAHHFFRVRLWDQDDLLDQLLAHYENLDEDLKTELPLKRMWTVAMQEEGE
jgi:restriction system protein